MASTVNSYTAGTNAAEAGMGFDGVVKISYDGYYGTGALLFGGRAVLTCAHLFYDREDTGQVFFETVSGTHSVDATEVIIMEGYNSQTLSDDVAIVWLDESAPVDAERYDIYRDTDLLGQEFTFVGYGVPATGSRGVLDSYSGSPIRQFAVNTYDSYIESTVTFLGTFYYDYTDEYGDQIVADFDNGLESQNVFKEAGSDDLGVGLYEGILSGGDSGGPAFVNGMVAGIASYGMSTGYDIDNEDNNSSYGEVSAWQTVSYYQQWIDQTVRSMYTDAPQTPEEVIRSFAEGDSGTFLNYFLLEFKGERDYADQWLTVSYSTRDGSASAGEDYFAVSGTLTLYPDENQVVIPVEIIGDYEPEADETFYMDVIVPSDDGETTITLSAVRTIIDDDYMA